MQKQLSLPIVLVIAAVCLFVGLGGGFVAGREHAKSQVKQAMQDAQSEVLQAIGDLQGD